MRSVSAPGYALPCLKEARRVLGHRRPSPDRLHPFGCRKPVRLQPPYIPSPATCSPPAICWPLVLFSQARSEANHPWATPNTGSKYSLVPRWRGLRRTFCVPTLRVSRTILASSSPLWLPYSATLSTMTSRYIHTVDTALIMVVDAGAGYIQALLDGEIQS